MRWEQGMKDYRGLILCRNCWDGSHDQKSGTGVIRRCTGNCECPCSDLAVERLRKKPVDKSLQTVIDTGDDVIVFGNPQEKHRDI